MQTGTAKQGWQGAAWARLRRPAGLVEQTRWLFCLCAMTSLALTLPAPLATANTQTLPLVLACSVALLSSWLYRYLTKRVLPALDLVDVLAVAGFALACPAPAIVFGFTFSALWFRALYGSTRAVIVHYLGTAAAIAAALLLWGYVSGHAPSTPAFPVLGVLPVMFVTVIVARHLALSLFAREQTQHRDTALARLATHLLGCTYREEIYERGWDTVVEICAATPGLRVVIALGDGERLAVLRYAGAFEHEPHSLPRENPSGAVSDDKRQREDWLYISRPEKTDGWILLGPPSTVPAEAIVAIQSLTNQVALAVRNCDAHQVLDTRASTDGLTGLANRAAFVAALELGLHDPGEGLAVLFVDLDDFKTVNDRHGHSAGDELLRHVAARLVTAVRPDDLCARLGGDEFAVLLHNTRDGVADVIAQRLIRVLGSPVTLMGRLAQVGASIGLARFTKDTAAEQLVQRADIAMYAAKAKGKNRVQVFDPSLLEAEAQALFDAELRAAMAAGQLVVHYQPIMSAVDGRCTAIEALVRWQHPVRGLLPPLEFIKAAETTGAIVGIGAFVLRRACADAADWSDSHGTRPAVHVNVSAAQLTDPDFVEVVRGCLDEFAIAPKQLVLEITESMVLDSPVVRATLDALVAVGVAIAIDDFGTGYSALTTLRTLPLDIVKIDRSFVSGCSTSTADHAVVEAIVQMAARLGLQTVAEGVERLEQQDFLRAVGADAVQGFLHQRPVPAAEIAAWLRNNARFGPAPLATSSR